MQSSTAPQVPSSPNLQSIQSPQYPSSQSSIKLLHQALAIAIDATNSQPDLQFNGSFDQFHCQTPLGILSFKYALATHNQANSQQLSTLPNPPNSELLNPQSHLQGFNCSRAQPYRTNALCGFNISLRVKLSLKITLQYFCPCWE